MLSNYEICKMKILVVAATQHEIEPFIKQHPAFEVLICGVGIPSTVYHLTKRLLQDKYEMVIQAGIAGSFSKKIKNGDVIFVTQDAFADIGVEENKKFKSIFQMKLADKNKFPFTNGWLINTTEFLFPDIKKVKGVTLNKISERKKQTQRLIKMYKADIESMEGAAFHYVCLQQKVPFLQLRSISNKVGERDKIKWKIKEAIEKLNLELKKLIDSINNQ